MKIVLDYSPTSQVMLIRTSDHDLFTTIRDNFSEAVAGAAIAKRRGYRVASKVSPITPTGRCEVGMYWEIKKFLIDNQIIVDLVLTPALKEALKPHPDVKFDPDIKYTFELYPYQTTAVKNAVKLGRGTIKLATGGGKTFITASIIENYFRSLGSPKDFRCFVIVPDLGLVEQTYNELINSGITYSCSKWTGSHEVNKDTNVIVVNAGILQAKRTIPQVLLPNTPINRDKRFICTSNTVEYEDDSWIHNIDLLIVDECHKVKKGNEITKIINKIKTPHKYGLSGTMPEKMIDQWNILGRFGPIIYEKPSHELRAEGYLTVVHVTILDLIYKGNIPQVLTDPYRNELTFIANSPFRNNLISQICNKLDSNTLIMVNTIEHGEVLYEELSKLEGKQVFFVRGDMEVEERERIKQIMESCSNVITVAISAIFATGINIKNIHTILFAAGGKSFVRTVQSIGRGLRKHSTKSQLNIIDIADGLKYGREHNIKRCITYEAEKISYHCKEILER